MKALIRTTGPQEAKGDILKGYEIFEQRGVPMPDPLKLITASPGYFSFMLQRNLYYSGHPNLSPALLAHIRYFIASGLDYAFCRIFNREMLLKMGITKEEFKAMGDDPDKSLLEPAEKKMLSFVVTALNDPEGVTQADIDDLKDAGWTDGDIFDAVAQGAGMWDHNMFMRIFKPGNE